MGVTGLWTVVHPCARPVKIETLNKKRLAVDASIWIYQFLKAVRDKEGNALRNSHVVGFFRRICKLLYFGIKPVFVFDGGAPALKRQTINNRKRRREGRREDAVRTAGKLLALQMQRLAEDEDRKRKEARNRDHPPDVEDEGPLPENPVYVEELNMTPQERQQNRKFKKKDAYHLPDLAMSLSEMGGPNDPRIMSLEELEQYALQFNNGEDINLYDFSKIDFDSPFFLSLPDADRYNILNAARIRSRLRMGYSKEQLDTMFPDRMAFSRFQIERVRERNELTQRLMHISGMSSDGTFGPDGRGRVAGEKNREYVLVKNDGAEGGWALGVVSGKEEGRRDRPIDVEKLDQPDEADDEDLEEDDDFEDVPIEGLNRLPKPKPVVSDPADTPQMALVKDMAKRRQAFYTSRRQGDSGIASRASDSLFVEHGAGEMETLGSSGKSGLVDEEEEADLQKAIAMSLQSQDDGVASEGDDEDDYREVFQQSRVDDPLPFAKGASQSIARIANARSNRAANQPAATAVSDDESDTDLRTALEESRRTKQSQPARFPDRSSPPVQNQLKRDASKHQPARIFDGPLPFESLNLGSSLLGRKRKENTSAADNEGGFEKQPENGKKKTEPRPLPPWLQDDLEKQQARQAEERRQKEEDAFASRRINYSSSSLRRRKSPDVIDLDEIPEPKETVVIDSSDDRDIAATVTKDTVIRAEEDAKLAGPSHTETTTHRQDVSPSAQANNEKTDDPPFDWEKTDDEDQQIQNRAQSSSSPDFEDVPVGSTIDDGAPVVEMKSPSPEFEDVPIVEANPPMEALVSPGNAPEEFPTMADDEAIQGESEDEDFYSDPEDEQLFQSLAAEAEEHARFAATWNNKSVVENALDYERELKQLRNQQKKDRRDADEVTQTMIKECQQLLTLFGLPYITAPMEAEAQCAELVSLGLVDGIVTDDSDIFLFGGTRVYKNMFNQAKFVECYLYSDLVSELGLDRKKLIAVAQLLGSDYTEGLPGVGPVTAMEILSEFGSLDAFKDWWTRVQNGTLPLSADNGPGVSSFRRKFRKAQATKLFLPPSFPDPRVEMAYLKPEVDSDPSAFQWGVPDLEALREFLMATIGWSRDRTDEVLVPVIRDMNKRETEGTQSNITAFFDGTVGAGAFAPRRREQGTSKRLMGALGRIREQARGAEERSNNIQDSGAGTSSADPRRGDGNLGEAEAGSQPASRRKRKGTVRHKESTTPNSSESGDEEYEEPRRKVRKGARGKSGN